MRAAKEAKQRGKEIPLSSPPPGKKKSGKIKYEPETMVIIPAAPAESVAQYSLTLPSANKDRMLDEMDMLRNITGHLNEIVSTMEGVYAKGEETKEEGEEEEEEESETSKEAHEEMTSFLICCSQLNNQLETALREEKQILESLLKWFEKEVHEMEEISVEQLIPDWEIPVADKNITDNITKLLTRIQRLEELKGRVQELPKLIQLSAPKQEKRKPLGPPPPVPKDPKNIIEELAMKHATEDVMNMVQVFQDDTGQPQTIEMMNNRMIEIMKIFERQTNKLHRVANEQDVLEGKLQKIQQEFRKLAEEKQIMEDELQKMKPSESQQDKLGPDTRKKMLPKIEKAKVEEKSAVPERIPTPKQKEHQKMKEDLAKAQANIQSLENEKKMLEEKLQKVLEEAQQAKGQLAEIPPHTPDWQFPYTAIVEDDKDIAKKGKKSVKSKSKGEDRTDLKQMSGTAADRAVTKLQKAETGKSGEILPGKSQDLSETKDVKLKRRGSVHPDTERRLSRTQEKDSVTLVEKLTDKKEESKKTKAKIEGKLETVVSKGLPKSKESAEIKRGRSVIKGAGKEAPELSHLQPLPPIGEKQQLPESTEVREEILTLDKSPEELLSPDSKRQKTEIMPSPEVSIKEGEDMLPASEEKASPLLSEFEVDASVGLEETMGESEIHPSLTMAPEPESTMIMEGTLPTAETSEKALFLEKEIPIIHTDSLELREDAVRDLISKNMVQLADHLTELKGMPEAETLAKLLLEPGKGMEELSDRQKLQLLNELITPDELQKVGETEEDQIEKKRKLFGSIASTLQVLQQTQIPEAGQSEKQMNEMAEKRRALLVNLESDLKELQQAQAVEPTKEDIDRKINKLSKKRSLLLESLESNMKDLNEAQALAAREPSEMNEYKVKELLQQREQLAANLEANLKDLQRAKTVEIGFKAKEINELSKQRNRLLENLKSNLKELEDAEVLAAKQPGSVSDEKIKGLQEQRKHLTALLETNEQNLLRAQAYAPILVDESSLQEMKLSVLSEKRKLLQEKLDSNLKDLQEAQMLASVQPDSMNERKVEELTEQRKKLTDDLKAAMNDMLEIQQHPSQKALFLRPSEREMSKIHRLSEKKQLLIEKLESNQKELQEAQKRAATQPGSVSAHTLQELSEQRKHLNEDLEATLEDIQNIFGAAERTIFIRPVGRELDDLSVKKTELLEKLELNRKELQEAQELAILQPGSISNHRLQTLFNQRRQLTTELETTMNDIQKAQDPTLEGTIQHSGRELYELSAKKHELMEQLKSNQKELQEAQELAAAQPGSISENKLQELVEQNRCLTESLEETLRDIVKVERLASERALIRKLAGRELHDLSAKKQLLQSYLDSNWKALQEAQNLAATQPSSINEQKVQELVEERRQLSADLKATIKEIREAEQRASERPLTEQSSEQELYDLFEKKHLLQGNLASNWKEIQEAQALEAAQPGSITERKLEELAQERRRLTEDLEKTVQDIQKVKHSSGKVPAERPAERELYELSERKQLLLENLKVLQEAQALAATQPGTVGEEKRKQLAEQKRRLAADLEATVHDMQKAQRASEIPVTLKPSEKELYELLEKKYLLLENLASNRKELQEAHALADAQQDSVSDHKLQVLNEQRKQLTEDLKATMHDIQEIQRHASQKALTEGLSGELFELSEKKQLLMESLESKQKELQEAKALAASQPGTISEQKLQELAEQKIQLTIALEATVHDIREIQHRTPQRDLPEEPCEKDLHKLFEWKQLLLEHMESNLKELEETRALAATEPDSTSEEKIQELNEQGKILTENLEAVVQEMQKTKAYLSKTGEIIRPIEKDLNQLFQKKKMFLERFESNLKELEAAQKFAATYPGRINEQKIKELSEERRLLAAGLEAIIEDLEVEQEVAETRGRERILEELTEKKKVFLHNLAFNLKELKQAQALAAAQPDSTNEQRVQELMEQTRLLAVGLDAIMQEIKNLFLDKTEIVKPIEKDLSEKRRWFLENLELNLEELKDLQAAATAEPGSVREQKRQELTEKRALLAANLESMLQDMQEAQASDLEQCVKTIPDEKSLNDLLVLSRLEPKLDELEKSGILSSIQLDGIRKKVHSLKEQKSSLIDKWEVPVVEEYTEAKAVDKNTKEKAVKEFIEQRKHLFSYLQSSIRDLQEKGIIRQSSVPAALELTSTHGNPVDEISSRPSIKCFFSEKDFQGISKEKVDLDKFLVAVPMDFLQSETAALHAKYGEDDEKITKQKVLAAKLEANIKDLQAALEEEKMGKRRYGASRDTLKSLSRRRMLLSESADHQQFIPSLSGLQIQISKAPVIKKSKASQPSSHRKAETEVDTSVQDHKDKLLQKETELAFKRQLMPPSNRTSFPQLPGSKISLPQLPSPAGSDISTERDPVDTGLQEVLNFNKSIILGQKTNLQQALQLAQQKLQQHSPYILAEKLRSMSVLFSQPSGTTRVHEYSLQPSRPVWEANQLPQKDYGHKLNILKRKLLGPEAKAVLGTSLAIGTSSPPNLTEEKDSIVICGKGCTPNRKHGAFPVIKAKTRHI